MDRYTFDLVNTPFTLSREPAQPRDISAIPVANREAYLHLVSDAVKQVRALQSGDFLVQALESLAIAVRDMKSDMAPPLRPAAVVEFVARRDSIIPNISTSEARRLPIAQAAALFAELSGFGSARSEIRHSQFADTVDTEIASYMGWKAVVEAESMADKSFASALSTFEKDRVSWIAEAQKLTENMQQHVLDLRSQEIELKDAIENRREEWIENVKTITAGTQRLEAANENLRRQIADQAAAVATSQGNLDAFKASVVEQARVTATKQLWTDRARDNRTAFYVSAALLAGMLIAVPVCAFVWLDVVLATLKHIGDAASAGIPADATATQLTVATISRLVVITFPLVLYLWTVRLIVRFNARSLMLHDDARQRQTMMDTYFMLIEHQAASTEERGLILNALFRPTPGQGPDNVEPPNFAELIGKTSGTG